MRSEVYKCSCGEIYFADPANPNPCPSCKKQNSFAFYLKSGRYNAIIRHRAKLYASHTEKDSDDFKTLTGEIEAKGGVFELKNNSSKKWTVTENGNVSSVVPNAVVILKKGITINFGGVQAEIV